ncbi:hypothetical protein HZB02_06735 [Candidatus Woesearchaeota archaeon]|nr:hypothetical protein [Candidatus Woesearchaeota archaeon]
MVSSPQHAMLQLLRSSARMNLVEMSKSLGVNCSRAHALLDEVQQTCIQRTCSLLHPVKIGYPFHVLFLLSPHSEELSAKLLDLEHPFLNSIMHVRSLDDYRKEYFLLEWYVADFAACLEIEQQLGEYGMLRQIPVLEAVLEESFLAGEEHAFSPLRRTKEV